MKTSMISISDIQSLGSFGSMEVELPDYKAVVNAKNQVSHVRRCYPREDGLTYTTTTKGLKPNAIKIMVVRPEEMKRRNKRNK